MSSVPDDYISELRSALTHLHNPTYLENHPLAQRISFVAEAPDFTRGQLLRRILRLSIEALDPGPGVDSSALEARPYQILRGRYILNQTMDELALQLDIGRRQVYRELRRALEALARILLSCQEGTLSEGRLPSPVARVRAEVKRLTGVGQQKVDLAQLLEGAVQSVRQLAEQRGTRIELVIEAHPSVAINRVMLRQAIINFLSAIVRQFTNGELLVRLSRRRTEALISFAYLPAQMEEGTSPGQPYAVACQILESLKVRWERQTVSKGTILSIYVPLTPVYTVLVIDDNEGLVRLFQRYLEGQPYHMYGVTNPDRALEEIERQRPDVIVLDVMMPGRDGWEILEALRKTTAGARARVLVCSIIDDPQLSAALGADAFLHKPVDQLTLLQALERLTSPEA